MSNTAVLLLDLQIDFLDPRGRMPVGERGAEKVIRAATAVLRREILSGAIPVMIVNSFSPSQRIGNWFRNNAAVAGSMGEAIDPRIQVPAGTAIFQKSADNAFTNPELQGYLQGHAVTKLCIMGVFTEACVRATALSARSLGYSVAVPLEGIASNAHWKESLGAFLMRIGGVRVARQIADIDRAT